MGLLLFSLGLLFAMNIGGNGTAASVGPSYGAGAVSKRTALAAVGLAMFLGAVVGSGEVMETIAKGIIPQELIDVRAAVIVLAACAGCVMAANLMGVPLSTSEVTVGALLGVGFAFGAWNVQRVVFLAGLWLAVPAVSFFLCFLADRVASWPLDRWMEKAKGGAAHARVAHGARLLLFAGGLFMAFAAGANNVPNAVGPLVASGALSKLQAQWLGGAALAFGAVAFGGRVIETSGKRITQLSLAKSIVVVVAAGGLTWAGSLGGIPVPMVQAVAAGTMGVGVSRSGIAGIKAEVVLRILQVWLVSPALSALATYAMATVWMSEATFAAAGALNMAVLLSVAVSGLLLLALTRRRLRQKGRARMS